jgi:citrate synthase
MLINVDQWRVHRHDEGMTDAPALIQVPPGLKGVAVTDTVLGDVRGAEGFYHYRQYSAVDLARQCSFEDVWFLFVEGHLPNEAERRAFAGEVAPLRVVPSAVAPVLGPIASVGAEGPLDGLRSALSVVAASHKMRPVLDIDPFERRHDALTLAAVTPTLVAALYRLQHGLDPIEPRPDLGTAANLLWMIGDRALDADRVRALEQYLIATIDHGFNASTFTARVIASTGADMGACVVGAVGALSGPLHGGAPGRALDLLDEIGTVDRIDEVVVPKLAANERIMGFGHAVYQGEDPRSRLLHEVALRQGGPRVALAEQVEARIVELLAERHPERDLRTNVEFYAGVVMESCGVPSSLFTPAFASSRIVGWGAHVLEQAADSHILRPSSRYTGPPAPAPLPSAEAAA